MLVCHTDKLECCDSTMEGTWIEIGTKNTVEPEGNDITDENIIRGDGTVNLTSLESNRIREICCKVPNAIGIIQTICVHSGQYCIIIIK